MTMRLRLLLMVFGVLISAVAPAGAVAPASAPMVSTDADVGSADEATADPADDEVATGDEQPAAPAVAEGGDDATPPEQAERSPAASPTAPKPPLPNRLPTAQGQRPPPGPRPPVQSRESDPPDSGLAPDTGRPARAAPRQPSEAAATPGGSALPSLEALSKTRERPLFVVGRRGPEPAKPTLFVETPDPEPAEPAASELTLVLNGLASGPELAMAILTDPATSKVKRMKTGEEHDGWTLVEIDKLSATFTRGDEKTVLQLRQKSAAAHTTSMSPEPGFVTNRPPPAWINRRPAPLMTNPATRRPVVRPPPGRAPGARPPGMPGTKLPVNNAR